MLIQNLLQKNDVMTWDKKVGKFTTNIKIEVELILIELSAAKIMMLNFHVDDSAKSRYDMILVKYLLTELVLNLNVLIMSLKQKV